MTKTAPTPLNSHRRREDSRAATTFGAAAASNPERARAAPWEGMTPELPCFRAPELYKKTGLSQSTVYEMVKAGTFPPPIKIGPRVVAWPSNHIAAWFQSRVETVKESRPAGRGKTRRSRAVV